MNQVGATGAGPGLPDDATTATALAHDPAFSATGITKQAISKQVGKFRDRGLLETYRQGREVLFSRSAYLELRDTEGDISRAHLRVDNANPVRTEADEVEQGEAMPAAAAPIEQNPFRTAAQQEASRLSRAKATQAEVGAALAVKKLREDLGQWVKKADVEAMVRDLLAPVQEMTMDGAPELSRLLAAAKDERERTQLIRAFYRERLNGLADKFDQFAKGSGSERDPTGGISGGPAPGSL